MKATLLVLLTAVAASAAVDGVVVNRTTGNPQAGVPVTLMQLGSGMNSVGTVRTDAAGKFTFDHEANSSTPYLLQAFFEDVTYNQMLQPGQQASGIELPVYASSANAPDAKVVQHMILLEPAGEQLAVNESVIFHNTGNITFQDPKGTLRFYAPAGADNLQVRIVAPQGMPITRNAEEGGAPNTYAVRYPVKPGETRIDISYQMPATTTFNSRILHSGGPVRIIAPNGVTLEGAALTDLGKEPRTQASVYELQGAEMAINIAGTGSLREMAGSQQPDAAAGGGEGTEIVSAPPLLFKRIEWVVAFIFGMLAVGFFMLFKSQPAGRA